MSKNEKETRSSICPDDIDEKARCLCEDFDITEELCKECWDAFIEEQLKEKSTANYLKR